MLNAIKKYFRLQRFLKRNPKVTILYPYYIEYFERVTFTGCTYIGPHSYWSAKGGIVLGNNVIFGPRTTIWTYNHNLHSDIAIPYGGEDILGSVQVCDNVWVGLGTIILPGVTIGEGAVIASGAVVTKDIPSCKIVGGNPAEVISERDVNNYEKLKKCNKYYLQMKKEFRQ